MSKELVTKDSFKPPLVTGGRVKAIIPENIEQAFRMATAIAAADMAPKSYNGDANKIVVGIMHGMEVGLPPMAALQSIAVINGMPCIWGDGALALVRGSGTLEEFTETLEGEGDARVATCWVKRKDEVGLRRSFSVADAKTAELWTKKGPWQTYPQRMLQMRARSWALRDGFADILRGLRIAEEAQDMGNLYQAADGAYVPEGKPMRAHYVQAAEARQRAAEPDLDAEHRRVTTGYIGDDEPGEPDLDAYTDSPAAEHRRVTTGYSGDEPEEPADETDEETESASGETNGTQEGPGEEAAVEQGRAQPPVADHTPALPAAKSTDSGGQKKATQTLSGLKAALVKIETQAGVTSWLLGQMVMSHVAKLDAREKERWEEALDNHMEALVG